MKRNGFSRRSRRTLRLLSVRPVQKRLMSQHTEVFSPFKEMKFSLPMGERNMVRERNGKSRANCAREISLLIVLLAIVVLATWWYYRELSLSPKSVQLLMRAARRSQARPAV